MASMSMARDFLTSFGRRSSTEQSQIRSMIDKFQRDPTNASLNLETHHRQRDPRMRTVRVSQFWRAVVIAPERGNSDYILVDVLPHDAAGDWLERHELTVNLMTGGLELCDIPTVERTAAEFTAPSTPATPDMFHGAKDRDFTRLGVDERVVPLLRRVGSAEELDTLMMLLPQLQSDAVGYLASGCGVDEAYGFILAAIDATAPATDIDPTDIVAAVARPASSAFFHTVDGEDELNDILAKPLDLWRVFLHPTQRRLAQAKTKGATRVLGGPGTGKTVVALHRAQWLAKQNPKARVLLTTFTTTMAAELSALLRNLAGPEIADRVEVLGIDKLASRLLRETDSARGTNPPKDQDLDRMFADACAAIGFELPASFVRHEWEQIVLAGGIESRADYFNAPRPGRGVRLNRTQRAQVWEVIELVTGKLGKQRTFLQLATDAAELAQRENRSRYDHVIVDEAQDLHPSHWRLLRAIVAEGPDDLFIVGDATQRIYDRRVVLSRYGISVRGRRSTTLKLNYRTTGEILRWSLRLIGDDPVDDLDDGTVDATGYRSLRRGELPKVTGHPSAAAELDALVAELEALIDGGVGADEILVAARTVSLVELIQRHLSTSGLPAVLLTNDRSGEHDAIHVATLHRLKGLEYRHVCLVDISQGVVPLEVAVEAEANDALQHRADIERERALLFVGATRARDSLSVSYHGRPSPFLPA